MAVVSCMGMRFVCIVVSYMGMRFVYIVVSCMGMKLVRGSDVLHGYEVGACAENLSLIPNISPALSTCRGVADASGLVRSEAKPLEASGEGCQVCQPELSQEVHVEVSVLSLDWL